MRLEISASMAMGFVVSILGIVQIIIGVTSQNMHDIIGGFAFTTLGVAGSALGIERLLNFKLDKIHEWLGPYEAKKLTLFEIRGKILKFAGICAHTGGTIILILSVFGYLTIEYRGLSLALIAIGLAFSSLGRMHDDNSKFDDIAEEIDRLHTYVAKIADKIENIDKNIVRKSNEDSEKDNISDVER